MPEEYKNIKKRALTRILDNMAVAARTAPKTRGWDRVKIVQPTEKEKKNIVAKMKKMAEEKNIPSFLRDASCIEETEHLLLIGVEQSPMELNCGFCGYPSCAELAETESACAFNSIDLGIALGSAASVAAHAHIDNRLMHTVGRAALEIGILGKNVAQAIGIPLSATGKNPFFDRG